MRIIELKAENVKRLKAVQIRPDGDTVVIAGRNAQGKSSVLDAIWLALAGAAGAKETTRPIRDGEDQASVELNLGDLVVTRKWTKAGSSLVVAAPDGASYPKPQTVLDGLLGYLSFDPLEFSEQDAKTQLRTLLDVVDLPFDPTTLDMQRKGVFDQRTEINREVKRLEGVLSEIPVVPDNTPDEEVVVSEIADDLARALDAQRSIVARRERIVEQEAKVAGLHESLEIAEQMLADSRQQLQELGEPPDPGKFQQELDRIDETNGAVRAKLARKSTAKALSKAKEDASHLTTKLLSIDREKSDAIADAKMPIDGLSFDEEGVLYQGIPFSQVSDSERLRVSIAMAMALNPKIRVIRITDGSLLDAESMALVTAMAAENDHQIWIERVAEGPDGVAVYIEDGEVSS